MVDSIKPTISSGISADLRIGQVARVARPVDTAVDSSPSVQTPTPAPTLAKSMAAAAPVDADRVRLIKDAVANGTFPLSPATIADRLIALRYEWMSHDAA